jgi:iron complex outermembrane receptor protein/vitamin B12 transporter
MSNLYLKPTLLAASMLLPGIALAQAEAPVAPEDVLVTGTYTAMPLADLTSSVSVLDAATLRALNKRSVADMLRTVPGLLVEEQGGAGGLTAVSIRGGEANFTLVLLDGVPVNDPTNSRGGGFDFSNLDPGSVERIEIVRGPQSAVYGSDGLAGVINVITRRGQEGHQQQLRTEFGDHDYENYRVSASGQLGTLGYAASLARRDEGEAVEGSTRKSDIASVRLDWEPTTGHMLHASYRYLDGERTSYPEQSGGPGYAVIDDLDDSDYTDKTMALGWQVEFSSLWRSGLTATRYEHGEDYDSPGISPFFEIPPNSASSDYERNQLLWVNALSFDEGYQLNLGADYRDETGDSVGVLNFGGFELPTDFSLDRSTSSLFMDGHARVTPGLLLQGSVRYDDPDDFGSETTWRLGARYEPLAALSLAANWGEAFKLPSFAALGHALVGNPDLQPETSESWDLGFSWAAVETLEVGATYFFNDYKDLVDFDDKTFRNVNRNQVETSGVELEVNWLPMASLSLQAHATYTDIEVKDDAAPLLGRPEWKAGATALWQIREAWSMALDYQWSDEQLASSRHTGESVIETLDAAHRFDVNLSWQAMKYLALELAVDNLLDEDYETAVGFPAPGRVARLSVSLSHW